LASTLNCRERRGAVMGKKRFKNENYLKDLLSYQDRLSDIPALNEVRAEGAESVRQLPFPQTWFEDWKYTNLKPLTKHSFSLGDRHKAAGSIFDLSKYTLDESVGSTIVFVNGYFSAEQSDISELPSEVFLGSLAEMAEKQPDFLKKHLNNYIPESGQKDAFTQFSAAMAEEGYCLHIPEGTSVSAPIHVLNLYTNAEEHFFATTRNLIIAEKGSEATIVEDHIGLTDSRYFTLPVTELSLEAGAHIKHVKVQNDGLNAVHIARPYASVAANADYHSYTFGFGAKLFRNDPHIIQTDEEVSFTLDGLVLISGDQISDTHSTMDHKHAFAESHQLHKVVVDENAHSIFNGKIFVRQYAQKIDSFQENRNLMLSRDSTIDTKPQLEIFADDVKCSHGATVGQLDVDELFYLRSRGLSEEKAKQMLTYAFALDIVENIEVKSLKERLGQRIHEFTSETHKVEQPV